MLAYRIIKALNGSKITPFGKEQNIGRMRIHRWREKIPKIPQQFRFDCYYQWCESRFGMHNGIFTDVSKQFLFCCYFESLFLPVFPAHRHQWHRQEELFTEESCRLASHLMALFLPYGRI